MFVWFVLCVAVLQGLPGAGRYVRVAVVMCAVNSRCFVFFGSEQWWSGGGDAARALCMRTVTGQVREAGAAGVAKDCAVFGRVV